MIRGLFILEQHLGHQTYAENLRFGLAYQEEIDPCWAAITYAGNGWLARLPLPQHLRGTLRGRQQVRHMLRTTRYDVALFNTQVPAVLAGKMVTQRPYVIATDITPRQYDAMAAFYHHRADRPGLIAAMKHHLNVQVFQRAAWVLPWSQWVRDSLIRDYHVAPERIRVIPPGIDLTRWQPRRERAAGPLRILFVGGDFVRKGGPTLLDAVRRLTTPVELHIVTRSPLDPAEGVFVYHDVTPNSPRLIELYQQADLFVFPTRAEAFGIAALEAIASGVPVITTPVGGLPDIVRDGVNGFLVPPDEPGMLAARLQLLIDQPDLRLRMAAAARRHAEIYFDAIKNAAQIAELMVQAVAQARRVWATHPGR
ncbi:MAG TPA: glycosyl transferase family 1 [Chloroflexus aurantiacus]|jgi:glycosyltransferase involved in cell wall biosynthesis|uniref:Glycosyl transferase group 1 n=1 Tax=Chloroflexus aurantiacus (strain ATCC 29366 / DSM 635 / J-10-fl) TaxID=324602 RepID=A9WBQ4_CHLAA|nr:glycosyltransferase family 4 protein [Chloroflexus aurantiacus]ABY34861.1 glycosyl transferase group 1 [Chloroflexus aurantiacus J-10-fl]RMG48870.1 MAG: glycosyltransferase [Chloroflexota bacterium]GIV92795.1 MAG: glycosyl transferase family 1 [Chloroflexus sp.]HBW67761.1 glycosyl transferase family 1 [Chloroflexus aurantiacus]